MTKVISTCDTLECLVYAARPQGLSTIPVSNEGGKRPRDYDRRLYFRDSLLYLQKRKH